MGRCFGGHSLEMCGCTANLDLGNASSRFVTYFLLARQFLEERELGKASTVVPPPSLQRFIGAEGFAAFIGGDKSHKRHRVTPP